MKPAFALITSGVPYPRDNECWTKPVTPAQPAPGGWTSQAGAGWLEVAFSLPASVDGHSLHRLDPRVAEQSRRLGTESIQCVNRRNRPESTGIREAIRRPEMCQCAGTSWRLGCTKLDDIELDDDVKPADSHLALNTIVDDAGTQRQIVRFNMPFGAVGAGGIRHLLHRLRPRPGSDRADAAQHVYRQAAGQL